MLFHSFMVLFHFFLQLFHTFWYYSTVFWCYSTVFWCYSTLFCSYSTFFGIIPQYFGVIPLFFLLLNFYLKEILTSANRALRPCIEVSSRDTYQLQHKGLWVRILVRTTRWRAVTSYIKRFKIFPCVRHSTFPK
jgi:hypothetical protein